MKSNLIGYETIRVGECKSVYPPGINWISCEGINEKEKQMKHIIGKGKKTGHHYIETMSFKIEITPEEFTTLYNAEKICEKYNINISDIQRLTWEEKEKITAL